MARAYERHMIADFRTGWYFQKAPWLAPADAFPTLTNGRITKGVLEKRYGSTLLGATGAGQPIMGIFEARYKGVPFQLVLDTKRVYLYDLVAATLTDITSSDIFTGTDADFFRFCTYYTKTYFVNGIDGIRSFDGSSNTIASVSTAGGVTITTCDGLFMLKSCLHFVAPTIGGVYYPDRIYYSDVGAVTITNSTQYYTYERDDVAVAYHPIDANNELMMGHKGWWRVEYTGDTDTPFRAVPNEDPTACLAPFGVVQYQSPTAGKVVAMLSRNHWVGFDGYRWQPLDWPIQDITQQMAATYLRYCQATRCTEKEALYISYPRVGQQYPDRVLEYGVDDNAWSEHTLSMHCISASSGEVDPTDLSLPEHHIGRTSRGLTLAGDRSGNLYQLDVGDDDNGATVAFTAISAALNPYLQQGRKAYLGWLDFYLDNDANASFTVDLYKDDSTTAWKTIPVSCSGSGDRFWLKVSVGGEVGNCHRIKISNSDGANRPRIHAICVWTKPGGLMSTSSSVSDWPDMTWRTHTEGGVVYIQRKESGSWVTYQSWGE